MSPFARELADLFQRVGVILAAILALVTFLVVYAAFRYHHRDGDPEPPPTYGNRRFEAIWIGGPLLLVSLMFFWSVRSGYRSDPPVEAGRKPDIMIIGHQWWWEVRYGDTFAANEIHIPTNQPLLFAIQSADVIHDWWVAPLGRKVDALPDFPNFIWQQADAPGTYWGSCAEYCGSQHAWMRIQVIAQPQADFDRWLNAQSQPAFRPTSGDAAAGADLFQKMTCGNCHAVNGTPSQARVGPDLTHFGSRTMIASGRMENTTQNLEDWLADPARFKPGVNMPQFRAGRDQIRQIAAYLEALK